MKVAEAPSDAFGQLQQAVDRFHDAIGQYGFHVSQDTIEVAFDGASQVAERGQARALGPSQPTFELRQVTASQSILQKLTQNHCASQGRLGGHELGSALLLFTVARPRIATQGPRATTQIGTLSSQALADFVQSLASHLHDV
jgi:hypothetical protein